MSVSATHARGRSGPWRPAAGHVFVSGYVVLLITFGVAPTVYALYLAFTDGDGR